MRTTVSIELMSLVALGSPSWLTLAELSVGLDAFASTFTPMSISRVAPAARDPGPIQMAAPPSSATNQSGVLAQPLYRNNPEPTYPLAARRRRQEGVVLLLVRVTAQGRASHVALKQTSGFKLLDEAASASVLTWNFEPARVGTDAIESDIEVPVRFRLTR